MSLTMKLAVMKLEEPKSETKIETVSLYYQELTTQDRRKSKTLILSMNVDKKLLETGVFDCHLSTDWRQMAIENTVS